MLVRKGIGRPPQGVWEARVYQLLDDAARRFVDEDAGDLSA
jgi:hypothetical protein